jgi:PAS domain S-box-containing protein
VWLLQIGVIGFVALVLTHEVRRRQTSEDRFAKVFDANPGGILLTRRHDGLCLLANQRFVHLTGHEPTQLLGHTTVELDIITATQRQALLAQLDTQGSADGVDMQLKTRCGAVIDVHYVIVPLEIDGEQCLLSSFYDISERKRVVQQLRHLNDELEQRVVERTAALEAAMAEQTRLLRLKGEFLGMVSHELRTPLTGVLAMTEMLADEVAGPLNARQHLYVSSAHRSGERLLEIVNSILSYTHLISGDLQLQYEPIPLAYLLDVASASLRQKAEEKQQTFTLEVDPPELVITTDVSALTQVLKRLLDNAVKFTPNGGAIGILAQVDPDAHTVQITVWDTGIGVPEGSLVELVKPFTQNQERLTRHYEGIGMGLAHVHRMLPLLGGRLELQSVPGTGSHFIVMLPIFPTPPSPQPLPHPA